MCRSCVSILHEVQVSCSRNTNRAQSHPQNFKSLQKLKFHKNFKFPEISNFPKSHISPKSQISHNLVYPQISNLLKISKNLQNLKYSHNLKFPTISYFPKSKISPKISNHPKILKLLLFYNPYHPQQP